MVKHDPEDFLGYQRMADVFKEFGHIKEAREYYASALEKAKVFKNPNKRNVDVKESIIQIKKELDSLKE